MLRKLLPNFLKESLRLQINRRRFKGRKIDSHMIGPNVTLGRYSKINRNVQIVGDVCIGDYTYINNNSIIGSNVRIGKFCSISYNCQIGLSTHPTDYITTSPYMFGKSNILDVPSYWEDYQGTITIGNDVWIGSNSIIMQGVTIGDGAIIAAGAVVTKSVHPYEIVGGVPAKIIRKRFTEDKIEYLLKLKWWDWSEEELRNKSWFFTSKEKWHESL